jgi:uncharacterized protein
MDLSRRQFVYANLALSSAAVSAAQLDDRQEWILGGGQFAQAQSPGALRRAVSIMSLEARQPRLIDVDFFPHGFAIHPSHKSRVACFQKIGPGAAIIDLVTGQMVDKIAKQGDQLFYGHGVYTLDGKTLLSTERNEQSKRGLIAMRDAKSLAYLGEFPSFGDSPHDCHLIEQGKILVVANGDGSVCYIELGTQKLLEKLAIPNPKLNAGHLLVLPQRKLVAVSAPAKGLVETDLGGISVRLSKTAWSSIQEPEALVSQMSGEALSVAASAKSETFAVTHPTANLVSFWSTIDGRALGSLPVQRPRGVETTNDGSKFLLSYGQHAGLMVIDGKTLSIVNQSKGSAYFSGSHILNWSRAQQLLA